MVVYRLSFLLSSTVVSSLGEDGLNIIYPAASATQSNRSNEANFQSIAFIGHEAEIHFHSLQPVDIKKPEVAEQLKLKCGGGQITEDEMRQKISVLFEWGFRGREWPFTGVLR